MKIFLTTTDNEYLETISFKNLDDIYEIFKQFSSMKVPLEAKIFAINESISSHQLSKFKNNFDKFNICFCIYSNNRDTVIAGNSLKINSTLIEKKILKKFLSPQKRGYSSQRDC